MNKIHKKWSRIIQMKYIFIGATIFASLAAFFSYFSPLQDLDFMLSDAIYQAISHNINSSLIKIISIDNKTIEKLGNYSEWSREETAKFIEILNKTTKTSPDVIGIDLNYEDKKDETGDTALVNICSKYSNLCFRASATMENEIINSPDYKISPSPTPKATALPSPSPIGPPKIADIAMPYDDLLPYIKTGVINTVKNSNDGYIRNAIANVTFNNEELDSFAVAIYKMYMDSQGKNYSLPKLDEEHSFAFNYSKKSQDYNVYSFYDVISGKIDSSTFKNSIVLVGDYTDKKNTFKVPNQKDMEMHEIEVQANILEALLEQKTGQNVSRVFLAVFYAIFAASFFIATSYSTGPRTMITSTLFIVMQIIFCCLLNHFGYYVPILIPIIFVTVIALSNLTIRYVIAKKKKSAIENVFKKYVDEQVVNEIVKDGNIEAKIGVERKDIAVLFVDIRGFTSLSECLKPEEIVNILNNYLTVVSNAVTKNSGTLDKFIGDAAMAVFNSPFDIDDYVYKAVCTAWDILSSASKLNEMCQKEYKKQVTFGIGIHCGEAVIGNIGCENRMDYTAIGDTVNTASRIEGIAGPGQILISSDVKNRLNDRIKTSFAGEFALKGKKNKLPIYIVEGLSTTKSVNPFNEEGKHE